MTPDDAHLAGGHGHAVVIGSSLAGLATARALANFMDHVTVVERDWVPRGPGRRRAVPQARHTHLLAPDALHGLEQLFPGIAEDLTAAGAVPVRLGEDTLVLSAGGWLPRTADGGRLLSASRDLTEAVLRERLLTEPKVSFLTRHEAVALEGGPHDTVTGVWVRRRERPAQSGGRGRRRLISADFVVDATGRDSSAPRWLAELGYTPPKETVLAPHPATATAVFTPPVGHVADFRALFLLPGHDGRGGQGMLQPLEGGRWSVSVRTGDTRPAPTGHAGLLTAAARLGHRLLHDLIAAATPLGPVYTRPAAAPRWRHYEKLRRWPDQFLVVGDAYATFDAALPQGPTHAVHCALVVDQLLAAHGTAIGLGYRLRRALARQLAPAWRAATHHTRPLPGGRGGPAGRGWTARLRQRLTARLTAAAPTDTDAAAALLTALHTPLPATAVLRWRLLRAALRGARRPAPAAPPSTTHGLHARPRRHTCAEPSAARPAAPARPATGQGAHGPHVSPAGKRHRP
ncbi:MAG: hypothetical protein H5T76_33785 [Streptomyces sp.]|nr:hypothetical protein [Streptomyces sp.]